MITIDTEVLDIGVRIQIEVEALIKLDSTQLENLVAGLMDEVIKINYSFGLEAQEDKDKQSGAALVAKYGHAMFPVIAVLTAGQEILITRNSEQQKEKLH